MTQLPIEQPLPSWGTGDKPVPLSAAFVSAGKSLDGRRGQFPPLHPSHVEAILKGGLDG
jgi:hypothetical protein